MSGTKSSVAIQLSQPYFSQGQIDVLAKRSRSRSRAMNESAETVTRLAAGDLMQTLGRQLHFPCRTICTAMAVWSRFHLMHPMGEYRMEEVAVAATFVASKLEDTPRKAKDVLSAAHELRHPHGPPLVLESAAVEEQRRRVLGLERMMLETQTFDFRRSHAHTYVVKFARRLGLPRGVVRRAWDVCSDAFRTWLTFKVPAYVLGAAALCVAGSVDGRHEIRIDLSQVRCRERDIDLAMLDIYDLYLSHSPRTLVGAEFGQDRLLELKAKLNRRVGVSADTRSTNGAAARKVEEEARSSELNITEAGDQGTCRFVLNDDRPRAELAAALRA